MSDLIDKVALAIWQEREKCFPARVQRMKPDDWDKANGAWDFVRNEARAAIDAMREPTPGMRAAGKLASCADDVYLTADEASGIWVAMIDAALNEGTST
jgi:hypothetical protein